MKWILLLLAFPVYGSELDVSFYQKSHLNSDDTYQIANWQGVQVSYGNQFYVFGSTERAQIIPLWGIGDLTSNGVGIGLRKQYGDLRLFGQVGYYFNNHEDEGIHRGYSEGLTYYFNSKYGFIQDGPYYEFDEYQIEYDDSIGITIGGEYLYPLTKHTHVGFGLSYTSMKISELFRVYRDEWNYEVTGWCWEQEISRDFSSFNASINLGWRF